MKITGNGYEISKYVNETSLSQEKQQAEKASNPTLDSGEDAVVNLSEESKEVQKARQVIDSEPDIRSEEVNAIRDQIEKGTYEIDYDKTAEQMLGQFIDEIVG